MVNPSQNLSKKHFHSYGFGSYQNFVHMSRLEEEEGYECNYHHHQGQQVCLGSDLALVKPPDCSMAEDESRTESINEEAHSASSKYNNDTIVVNKVQEPEKEEDGWLQLSIGGGSSHHEKKPSGSRLELVELDLLPPGPGGTSTSYEQGNKTLLASASPTPTHILFSHQYHVPEFQTAPPPHPPPYSTTSLFLQQQYPGSSSGIFPQEINWAFRPMATSSSYNLPIAPARGSHFSAGPFPFLHAGIGGVTGPSIDFRVIDPPRRPHSGIWFSLQASLTQAKKPFLHQISKSYLRIKDGRMTIRLVLKYLVNKLQLENESEIEITCKGQQLQPFLTLQHVRDHIWSNTGDTLTLHPPQSSTTTASNHVMVFHYGRSAA